MSCASGRNALVRWGELWRLGTTSRIMMDSAKARTPPSLLGMARRIA